MYFSVTFINSSGKRQNTWADWRMIPASPPMVEPPEPYTNYVEIPGRTEGPIDLSEAVAGRPTYKNSQGQWEFYVSDDSYPRMVLYDMLKKFLHGQKMKIQFEDDPGHTYEGRITVSAPNTGKENTSFTMRYTIAPFRYNSAGEKEGF